MDRSYVQRNRESSERLRQVIAGLSDEEFAATVAGGWTIGGLLAHLAHWDRFVLVRWQARPAGRATPLDIPDHVADLVNDAAMPTWANLAPTAVRELATKAAADTDAYLAGLDDDALAALEAEGRPRLADRSRHRGEHLDEIETALRRST